ncbi:ABC-three component system middle component 5 [Oceaniglobus ichthyenteri]|uniref:ABC-three component system middle component 5 n=1 Tax=Oceaniglobus ichthyenteri TaxID=2136177 RepID=UPI000D35DE1B|nr:ABC-three component system middle component 5 [Oceaniglobus ichthyenteri]
MTGRLWYPQLDVYDAARRLGGLLGLWQSKTLPSPERLFTMDFFLANAPLLHKTHMPQEVRKAFSELGVPRPEKSFVSYPSPQVLFQKMDEVQHHAFRTLSGKGLIELPELDSGNVAPSEEGRTLFQDAFLPLFSDSDRQLGAFLVGRYAPESRTISDIRQSIGLRRLVR